MGKVNPQDYGSGEQRPKLTPEVLGNKDLAVLTVESVHLDIKTGDGRTSGFLVFKERPEHAYWLNMGGITMLVTRLGDESDDWIGEKVPLVKTRVQNPQTGGKVVKYHVADEEDWDDAIEAAKPKRRGKKRAPAKKK